MSLATQTLWRTVLLAKDDVLEEEGETPLEDENEEGDFLSDDESTAGAAVGSDALPEVDEDETDEDDETVL